MTRMTCFRIVAACLAAAPAITLAGEAGSVAFVAGTVIAERAPPAPLAKGDVVFEDDDVVTGAASRAQLVMIDGAKIAIRPSSRISIDEYSFAAAQPASAVTTSADDSSVIGLVKGGFRTITGAIGDDNPQNYEVRTAVGVLGIRGTNFAVLLCGGDCSAAPGVPPGTAVPDGLYIMVDEGSIFFSNEVATIDVRAGEFLFVPFDTRRPERPQTTPPVFLDDSDMRFEADARLSGFDENLGKRRDPDSGAPGGAAGGEDEEEDAAGPRSTPAQSIRGTDLDGSDVDLTPGSPPDPQNRTITWSTGPLGQFPQLAATYDNAPTQYLLDAGNDLTRFASEYPGRTGPDIATLDIGTAGNAESGFDSVTVLRWGRWAGGTATATLSDGTVDNVDLGAQSLHWVTSPGWASPPVMPVTGIANYSLIGSTSPTDNLGNTGVLGDATFVADFTNMSVLSTLDITIGGSNWLASGQGGIGAAADPVVPAHLFNGQYGAITIDGVTGGFGLFSGFFSEPGPASDPSFPGGAALTFTLQDMTGTTTVSGAAAFGNP